MGCSNGCRLVVQGQQTADGNVAGWHGPDVKYDDGAKKFTLPGGGSISAGARMEEAVFPTTTSTTALPDVPMTVTATTEVDNSSSVTSIVSEPTSTTITPPVVDPVADGESVVVVDGEAVAMETIQSADGIQVLAGELTATMSPVNDSAIDDATFNPGDALTVDVAGLLPNSTADITIHSEPRNLGQMTVDASGRLSALVQIPADMPTGNHTVVVRGLDARGDDVELRFGVEVTRETGAEWRMWVFVSLLLGATFLVLRRRNRSRTLTIT